MWKSFVASCFIGRVRTYKKEGVFVWNVKCDGVCPLKDILISLLYFHFISFLILRGEYLSLQIWIIYITYVYIKLWNTWAGNPRRLSLSLNGTGETRSGFRVSRVQSTLLCVFNVLPPSTWTSIFLWILYHCCSLKK